MSSTATDELTVDLARETMYRFFALALRRPTEHGCDLSEPAVEDSICSAIELLKEDGRASRASLGFGELGVDELTPTDLLDFFTCTIDQLAAEYDRVFGIGPTADFPPYETEFCANQEPFYRAQQMADVAGFYRAFGLTTASRRPERADHIALEFEFMAFLAMKQRLAVAENGAFVEEHVEICCNAQRNFLKDHLVWWAPSFAIGLRRKAADGPYSALARTIAAFLPMERRRFDIESPNIPVRPRSIERPEEQGGCEACAAASA